jgi:hypothetical protein
VLLVSDATTIMLLRLSSVALNNSLQTKHALALNVEVLQITRHARAVPEQLQFQIQCYYKAGQLKGNYKGSDKHFPITRHSRAVPELLWVCGSLGAAVGDGVGWCAAVGERGVLLAAWRPAQ